MTAIFSQLTLAPRDPILGLNEAFNSDTRTTKVNLGVGVYFDDNGKIPLLQAVRQAEAQRLSAAPARGYLPIEGVNAYNQGVQTLLFGADSDIIKEGRAITTQALGGTGALKIGADFLKRLVPNAKVLISDPSWENHRALFESAGFEVGTYSYYDAPTHGLNFSGMLADLNKAEENTIIVLHACCHNPTGVDLSKDQWQQVVDVIKSRGLIPFIDMAYQGFGDNIKDDGAAIELFTKAGLDIFISSSFSKSFSLYGERVGAFTIVTNSREQAVIVLSQVKRVIRTNYSNPPTHGASVVATVLNTPELRQMWEDELAGMRDRIRSMRTGLVSKLKTKGVKQDFSFVETQRGMFSYSGLTSAQVDRLRDEFGIYAVGTGRICLAAMNSKNIDAVVDAIAAVI
jgi:aromatic-amino-acid transaminase